MRTDHGFSATWRRLSKPRGPSTSFLEEFLKVQPPATGREKPIRSRLRGIGVDCPPYVIARARTGQRVTHRPQP